MDKSIAFINQLYALFFFLISKCFKAGLIQTQSKTLINNLNNLNLNISLRRCGKPKSSQTLPVDIHTQKWEAAHQQSEV